MYKKVICYACQYRKQVKNSFKVNNQFFTNRALQLLQLLYMDFFGPMHVSSLRGKILHLLLLMIILDLHGFYFFLTSMKQLKLSQSFSKEFKKKKTIVLFAKLKVIMVENLTILLLKIVLTTNFILLKLHNKMEFYKEKIILFRKWEELC